MVPPAVPHEALPALVLRRRGDDVDAIASYVEWQAKGETVVHAEKVLTEHVLGAKHECWDVRTDKERWWVITGATNLYSQRLFPSLDYTLTFHVGLMARMAARHEPGVEEAEQLLFPAAWRRWEQAGEVLDEAEEAEDFQSVGMRCRECLVAMVRALGDPSMVPEGTDPPQRANVVAWCGLIAEHVARGASAECVRGYLKAVAKSGWAFVNWLTHAHGATRADGLLAHELTQHVLSIYGTAVFRHRRGIPDRCASCGSYKVGLFAQEPGATPVPACQVCGWTQGPAPAAGAGGEP
ncbi:hypothetical protein [Roseicella sp. DB1501]|uniref:hypothetical protein n=1 Tax=Roseicella sp. DB1501 TaxID=2730925 RepID=UPI001492CC90|nr:hypothetical protein [Roseicella sp. DB1501]NOG74168.1 hypothetical protein [Roseicella sp. DB1501]